MACAVQFVSVSELLYFSDDHMLFHTGRNICWLTSCVVAWIVAHFYLAGDYEAGDTLTPLVCKHVFHADCIASWLRVRHTCPLCVGRVSRASYVHSRDDHDHDSSGDGDDTVSEGVGGREWVEQRDNDDGDDARVTAGLPAHLVPTAEINPMSRAAMGSVVDPATTTTPPGSPASTPSELIGIGMMDALELPQPSAPRRAAHQQHRRRTRIATMPLHPEAAGTFSTEHL